MAERFQGLSLLWRRRSLNDTCQSEKHTIKRKRKYTHVLCTWKTWLQNTEENVCGKQHEAAFSTILSFLEVKPVDGFSGPAWTPQHRFFLEFHWVRRRRVEWWLSSFVIAEGDYVVGGRVPACWSSSGILLRTCSAWRCATFHVVKTVSIRNPEVDLIYPGVQLSPSP